MNIGSKICLAIALGCAVLAAITCVRLYMQPKPSDSRPNEPVQQPAEAMPEDIDPVAVRDAALKIGETVEIVDNLGGMYMTPVGESDNCAVGTGGAIRLIEARDGFVLIECVRTGDTSSYMTKCLVGGRAVLSEEDYRNKKAHQACAWQERRKEERRREAEKLFN